MMTPPSLKRSSYRIRLWSREDEIVRGCVVPRPHPAGRRPRSFITALFYFLLNLLSLTSIDACGRPWEREHRITFLEQYSHRRMCRGCDCA
jgi:hypothetical protein